MPERKCNACTACCDGWIIAKVNDARVAPDRPCKFSTEKGCAIYSKRPYEPCVTFKCGWLMDDSPLPDHMSPLECGAIILTNRKWPGGSFTAALPVGARIPDDTLDWLITYSQEQSIPLLVYENVFENGKYIGRKQSGFGPPAFAESLRNTLTNEDVFRL